MGTRVVHKVTKSVLNSKSEIHYTIYFFWIFYIIIIELYRKKFFEFKQLLNVDSLYEKNAIMKINIKLILIFTTIP